MSDATDGELTAVRRSIDGAVATVWLDRPHLHNARTGTMDAETRDSPPPTQS
jgi:hypothetical protein